MTTIRKYLQVTYAAAIAMMTLETIYVAYIVVRVPDESWTLAATLDLLRALFVPAIFELLTLGLVDAAQNQTGRQRATLWGGALFILAATSVMQAGAMSAHPVDPDALARMGPLYWIVRYVIAIAGPLAVGIVASIKLSLNDVVGAITIKLADVNALLDAAKQDKAEADQQIAAADARTAQMLGRYEKACEEIAALRQQLKDAKPVAQPAQLDGPGRIDRTLLADRLRMEPDAPASDLAQLFGVSSAAIRKTDEWRNARGAA